MNYGKVNSNKLWKVHSNELYKEIHSNELEQIVLMRQWTCDSTWWTYCSDLLLTINILLENKVVQAYFLHEKPLWIWVPQHLGVWMHSWNTLWHHSCDVTKKNLGNLKQVYAYTYAYLGPSTQYIKITIM